MDNQSKVNQLIESARQSQRIGEWAVLIGMAFVLIGLLVWAIQVWWKGLKITGSKTMTGTPAKILAVVLAAIAIAIGVYGILVWPGLPN
jgi:predicted transporter